VVVGVVQCVFKETMMWLYTRLGFFSVTAVGKFDKEFAANVGEMQIRARSKKDLMRLIKRFQIAAPIVRTPGRDYLWRVIVGRDMWKLIARGLAEEIDWDNFKTEAAAYSKDEDYVRLLHDVWQRSFDYQVNADRPRVKTDASRGKAFSW
jgi:hypothetical protein